MAGDYPNFDTAYSAGQTARKVGGKIWDVASTPARAVMSGLQSVDTAAQNFGAGFSGSPPPSAALTAAADHVAGAYGTNAPNYKAPVDDRQGDATQITSAVPPNTAASYPSGPKRQVGTTTLGSEAAGATKTVGADGKVSYSGGTSAVVPSPLDTVRSHYTDLLTRAKALSSGSTADKVVAAGLSKRAASLSGLLQGEAAAAHSMGQLHLQAQQQYPQIAATLAFLKAHENGDPNAYKILSGLHGNDPNAPMVAPFMAGVIRPSDVTPGGVTLGQGQGGTMGLQPLTPLPSLR